MIFDLFLALRLQTLPLVRTVNHKSKIINLNYINTMKKIFLSLLFCCVACVVLADPVGPARALKMASPYLKNAPMEICFAPARYSKAKVEVKDSLAPYYIISRGDGEGHLGDALAQRRISPGASSAARTGSVRRANFNRIRPYRIEVIHGLVSFPIKID